MTHAAAIKFVQGATVGTAGVSLVGVLSTTVTVSNGDDTNVQRWKYSWIGVPPGSAVPLGLVQDGLDPDFTFSPDVRGDYHVELVAYDLQGAAKVDRRTFRVLQSSGRAFPAFDAQAAQLNFAGNTRGWSPDMEAYLQFLDLFTVGTNVPLGSARFTHTPTTAPSESVTAETKAVQTANATPTEIYRFAIPADGLVEIVATIRACGASSSAVYKQSMTFRRVGSGAAAIIGSTTADDLGFRPASAPFVAAPAWTLSTNDVVITATGIAGNVRWGVTAQITRTADPT